MDISRFGSNKVGQLVEFKIHNETDWAFIPYGFPIEWEFPVGLWPLLAEAKESIGSLKTIGLSLPRPGILLKPLRAREAIRSSALEGTYATPQQLMIFGIDPKEPKSKHDQNNSTKEVFNYERALELGFSELSKYPLSWRLIRSLHQTLLTGVRGEDKKPGEFRKILVSIGNEVERKFNPPPPEHLPGCLDNFEEQLSNFDQRYDPLVYCFLLHYLFEVIHPFNDGNGRIGRLLLSLMIAKYCIKGESWLFMSAYFEKNRDDYLYRLFEISANGAWAEWIEFCLYGVIEQSRDTVERCTELLKIRDNFKELVEGSGEVPIQIVDRLFEFPILSIPAVADRYSVTYPTAKSYVQKLVKRKILIEVEDVHPKLYYSPQIMHIAHSENFNQA